MKHYVITPTRRRWLLEEVDDTVVRMRAKTKSMRRYPLRRVLASYATRAEAERAATYYREHCA